MRAAQEGLFVVDEAHVITAWGDSPSEDVPAFRPAYGKLGDAACMLRGWLRVGLTATSMDSTTVKVCVCVWWCVCVCVVWCGVCVRACARGGSAGDNTRELESSETTEGDARRATTESQMLQMPC